MTKKEWAVSLSSFATFVIACVFYSSGCVKYLDWVGHLHHGNSYLDVVAQMLLGLGAVVLGIVWVAWIMMIAMGVQAIVENLEDR